MHIQIEGLITFKRNYFQYQIPFFFFLTNHLQIKLKHKLIHATCSRRTISKSSFSRRERKKKKRKESSCFQISVLASEEHRSTRKGGRGRGRRGKWKENESTNDVSDVAHGRPFIRPAERYLLGKESERERGKTARRGLCNLYLVD